MSRDTPRAYEREPPADAAREDERVVDVLAMEDEILAAEAETGIEPDDDWNLEDEDPLERAGRLNRLAQHGALARGFLESNEIPPAHTIDKHVGKTDAWLRERLEAEERTSVSTFTDVEAAERAIARVLRDASGEIDGWLSEGPRRDFRLERDLGWVSGRVMDASGTVRDSTVVRVLLWKNGQDFQIKTAYLL